MVWRSEQWNHLYIHEGHLCVRQLRREDWTFTSFSQAPWREENEKRKEEEGLKKKKREERKSLRFGCIGVLSGGRGRVQKSWLAFGLLHTAWHLVLLLLFVFVKWEEKFWVQREKDEKLYLCMWKTHIYRFNLREFNIKLLLQIKF